MKSLSIEGKIDVRSAHQFWCVDRVRRVNALERGGKRRLVFVGRQFCLQLRSQLKRRLNHLVHGAVCDSGAEAGAATGERVVLTMEQSESRRAPVGRNDVRPGRGGGRTRPQTREQSVDTGRT